MLLLSQFGHLAVFSISEMVMEKEFEARLLHTIPNTALEKIVDDGNLEWEEAGREVFYNGNLYDIVRTHTENGRTVYYALNDRQEKQLIDTYTKNLRREENSKESKSNQNGKFNPMVFTIPGSAAFLWIPQPGSEFYSDGTEKLPQQHPNPIPTPPRA